MSARLRAVTGRRKGDTPLTDPAIGRRLAHATQRLVKLCGGADEAAAACRVSATQLGRYTDPLIVDAWIPADIVAELEGYCGERVVSALLVELRPFRPEHAGPVEEGCDVGESGLAVQAAVRRAYADGELTPAEQAAIERTIACHEQEIAQLRAALAAAGRGALS